MANPTTGLRDSLVAAMSAAQDIPRFQNVLSACIFKQFRGQSAEFGETLQINTPNVNENAAINIGAGPLQVADTSHTTVNLTVNQNVSHTFAIPDFHQALSPLDLRVMYTDAQVEAVLRKVNRAIAAYITATNFATYTTITGGTAVFTRQNIAAAWKNLANAGAPMDPGNTFFVTTPTAYSTALSDPTYNFIQDYVVGSAASLAAQQMKWMPVFGAQMLWDQMMPLPGGKETGLFFHRSAIGMAPVRIPLANSPVVEESYVMLTPDIPARMQVGYDLVQQKWLVHLHVLFGLAIIRPEFGSFLLAA